MVANGIGFPLFCFIPAFSCHYVLSPVRDCGGNAFNRCCGRDFQDNPLQAIRNAVPSQLFILVFVQRRTAADVEALLGVLCSHGGLPRGRAVSLLMRCPALAGQPVHGDHLQQRWGACHAAGRCCW